MVHIIGRVAIDLSMIPIGQRVHHIPGLIRVNPRGLPIVHVSAMIRINRCGLPYVHRRLAFDTSNKQGDEKKSRKKRQFHNGVVSVRRYISNWATTPISL
jgi:hypothetical protein